jgi:hypothetical protein
VCSQIVVGGSNSLRPNDAASTVRRRLAQTRTSVGGSFRSGLFYRLRDRRGHSDADKQQQEEHSVWPHGEFDFPESMRFDQEDLTSQSAVSFKSAPSIYFQPWRLGTAF